MFANIVLYNSCNSDVCSPSVQLTKHTPLSLVSNSSVATMGMVETPLPRLTLAPFVHRYTVYIQQA